MKNSKLFQKFLKEEGQVPPKKPPNNFFSTSEEQQQNTFAQNNEFLRKNKPQPEPQRNLKKNEEIPRKVTPIKQERIQEPDDKYQSRKSNNEEDKELAGYSQIVPGKWHKIYYYI